MKKRLLFLLFSSFSLFASDPFQVPLDGKLYLSNLDESFLEKEERLGWVYVVKSWGKKKLSFYLPHFPKQESFPGGLFLEASQEGLTYTVKIEPKTKDFLKKRGVIQEKQDSKGGYELFFQDHKEKIILLQKDVVILSVSGEGFQKEEKFFNSFQEITPKKK